jgi:hypothetical protein
MNIKEKLARMRERTDQFVTAAAIESLNIEFGEAADTFVVDLIARGEDADAATLANVRAEVYRTAIRLRQTAIETAGGASDELLAISRREHFYNGAIDAGYVSEEIDGALMMADLSNIAEMRWDCVVLRDGTKIDRRAVRDGLRTAAYSDDAWRRHLASDFPKIEEPR